MQGRLTLTVAGSNLQDKVYRDHLDGINRAPNPAIPIGERLYGLGRSVELAVRFDW